MMPRDHLAQWPWVEVKFNWLYITWLYDRSDWLLVMANRYFLVMLVTWLSSLAHCRQAVWRLSCFLGNPGPHGCYGYSWLPWQPVLTSCHGNQLTISASEEISQDTLTWAQQFMQIHWQLCLHVTSINVFGKFIYCVGSWRQNAQWLHSCRYTNERHIQHRIDINERALEFQHNKGSNYCSGNCIPILWANIG